MLQRKVGIAGKVRQQWDIYRYLMVLEHKKRGRQLHLAKGPSSVAKGYKTYHEVSYAQEPSNTYI